MSCNGTVKRATTIDGVKAIRERELKLDVDPGFTLPDLGGRPIPPRTFTSTYFDTPEHRLLRSGITLRRRVENRKGVWQLKLPSDGGRFELEEPGGPTPPRVVPRPARRAPARRRADAGREAAHAAGRRRRRPAPGPHRGGRRHGRRARRCPRRRLVRGGRGRGRRGRGRPARRDRQGAAQGRRAAERRAAQARAGPRRRARRRRAEDGGPIGRLRELARSSSTRRCSRTTLASGSARTSRRCTSCASQRGARAPCCARHAGSSPPSGRSRCGASWRGSAGCSARFATSTSSSSTWTPRPAPSRATTPAPSGACGPGSRPSATTAGPPCSKRWGARGTSSCSTGSREWRTAPAGDDARPARRHRRR